MAMYRLGTRLPRSRFYLPLVDGEVRVCRELVPLRRVFLSDDDEVKTALSLRNKSSSPLLRHGGALLKRRRWGLGVLGVSPGPAMQLRLIQIRERKELGRGPGRWASAVGYFPAPR